MKDKRKNIKNIEKKNKKEQNKKYRKLHLKCNFLDYVLFLMCRFGTIF